jgi:hypothetical protein
MHRSRLAAATALLALACAAPAAAQGNATEFWPEVDAWWRLSPAWRLSLFVPISKNLDTHYREGNLIAQADYAWGHPHGVRTRRLADEDRARSMRTFMVRGGYLGGRSLGDQGEEYTERTLLGEFHLRIPLEGNLLLSHRLRTDLRWLGDDGAYSTRVRYRLMVERELMVRRVSLVPFANVEPYFDSRYDTANRIRVIGGTSLAWRPRFAIETNWTYQHDTRSSVTHLNALNVILHLSFGAH